MATPITVNCNHFHRQDEGRRPSLPERDRTETQLPRLARQRGARLQIEHHCSATLDLDSHLGLRTTATHELHQQCVPHRQGGLIVITGKREERHGCFSERDRRDISKAYAETNGYNYGANRAQCNPCSLSLTRPSFCPPLCAPRMMQVHTECRFVVNTLVSCTACCIMPYIEHTTAIMQNEFVL